MLGIYVRLSREDDENKDKKEKDKDPNSTSITNQIREGMAFVKKHSIESYEIYNEGEGLSGSLDINGRPELNRLVQDINSGKITSVWARNQNRIERSTIVYGFFVKLVKKHDIKVYFADSQVDFNDPSQKMVGGILSEISEYQLELQSIQIKKVLRIKAKEGRICGHICYGYMEDDDYQVIDPTTSIYVIEIFTRYVNGEGVPTITDDFNRREIPTIFDKGNLSGNWSPRSIYNILRNTTYFGDKLYGGEVYAVPPIIDKDLFNRAAAILEVGSKKKAHKHFYTLNGLLICGRCGHRMSGRSFGSKLRKYYMCSQKRYKENSCGSKVVRMKELDNLMWDSLFTDDTLYQSVKKAYKEGDNEKLRERLQLIIIDNQEAGVKLTKELERIKKMTKESIYTIEEGKEELQKTHNKITQAKDKVEEAEREMNLLRDERTLLDDLEREIRGRLTKMGETIEGVQKLEDLEPNSKGMVSAQFRRLEKGVRQELKTQVIEPNKITIGENPREKERIIKKYVKSITVHHVIKREFRIDVAFNLPIPVKTLQLDRHSEMKPNKDRRAYGTAKNEPRR